jgi:hypothetical protein
LVELRSIGGLTGENAKIVVAKVTEFIHEKLGLATDRLVVGL